ncbi:hypothetical protein JCM6882_001164 [Rhodosporidiobolus microsporus]
MRVLSALTVLSCATAALAKVPKWRKNIDLLLGDVAYINIKSTSAFTFWIQLVDDKLATQFDNLFKHQDPYTLLYPDNEAWDAHLTGMGANTTDIESLLTKEWRGYFSDLYPFFFFRGTLNTTALDDGETLVLESWKRSPVGDWPLMVAFRREASLEANATAAEEGTAFPYNGTFYSTPYGSGDVIIPDYESRGSVAQVVNYFPTIPKNLSVTVADLNVTGWDDLVKRSPLAAALETSLNYTLLLPPASAISSALSGSDDDVTAFVHAHLVSDRVVLSSKEKTFTTQAGASVTATSLSLIVGSVNATVTSRDVLTNGIIVQVIDRALTSSSNSTVSHTEL